jgi:cob(I)alamin adenosyltransferase
VTINLTRIYTRTGDGGQTHLGDMSRVPKDHPRVEAYGTVDELNSALGVALAVGGLPERFAEWVARVQSDLLDLGADLSVPQTDERSRLRVTPEYIEWLEAACDEVNAKLQPLKTFVIPGGTPAAAQLHVCRTICRRAERRSLAVTDAGPNVLKYLNRLSDLLFILARGVNEEHESLWAPGSHGASA